MNKTVSKLTVFFEDPFWVCLYERESNGKYEACKITFGAEPRDYEVYQFLLDNWQKLRFSPSVDSGDIEERRKSPKRMQREAKRAIEICGVGTKAQQALKLQQEQGKLERRVRSKERREAEAQRLFELKQEKRREKRKGH